MKSRSLQGMCCITQGTLFNICLSETDLKELGVWSDLRSRMGFRPAVWCRALLHRSCKQDSAWAQRVADRLDLRFLDTVILVRCMSDEEVDRIVDLWLERPDGQALPGLLWALCTDGRDLVHDLGIRLCHEALTIACQGLVAQDGVEDP